MTLDERLEKLAEYYERTQLAETFQKLTLKLDVHTKKGLFASAEISEICAAIEAYQDTMLEWTFIPFLAEQEVEQAAHASKRLTPFKHNIVNGAIQYRTSPLYLDFTSHLYDIATQPDTRLQIGRTLHLFRKYKPELEQLKQNFTSKDYEPLWKRMIQELTATQLTDEKNPFRTLMSYSKAKRLDQQSAYMILLHPEIKHVYRPETLELMQKVYDGITQIALIKNTGETRYEEEYARFTKQIAKIKTEPDLQARRRCNEMRAILLQKYNIDTP